MAKKQEPFIVSWRTNLSNQVNKVSFPSASDREVYINTTLMRNARVDKSTILRYTEGQ